MGKTTKKKGKKSTAHLGLVNEDGTQTKNLPLPILEKEDVLTLKLYNITLADAKKGVDLAKRDYEEANRHFQEANNTNLAFIEAMNAKYRNLGFKAFELRLVTVDEHTGQCVYSPEAAKRLANILAKSEKAEDTCAAEEEDPPEDTK